MPIIVFVKPLLKDIETRFREGRRSLALLIDPDHCTDEDRVISWLSHAHAAGVTYLFYGGSLVSTHQFEKGLIWIRRHTKLPIVLFPGNSGQITDRVDAILYLSLISGRNPDFLIGQQVIAAPHIKSMGLEALATGYMLVDCGKITTAIYVSGTMPIPYDKPEIASCTAMAGELLGLKMLYLDGGSGAPRPISSEMIAEVRKAVDLPIIVGGGIRSQEDARILWEAGADILVVGTAAEEDPGKIVEIAKGLNSSHETNCHIESR